jgi:hypothetical protein
MPITVSVLEFSKIPSKCKNKIKNDNLWHKKKEFWVETWTSPLWGLASAFLSKSYAVSKKIPPLTNSSTSFN